MVQGRSGLEDPASPHCTVVYAVYHTLVKLDLGVFRREVLFCDAVTCGLTIPRAAVAREAQVSQALLESRCKVSRKIRYGSRGSAYFLTVQIIAKIVRSCGNHWRIFNLNALQ